MKQELIKQAFKLGNSAGVLLPAEWKNRKVIVKLVDKSIQEEIFEILNERNLLSNTLGIFLAGSYARNEETESSDIDILIITDNINKNLKIGKYEIILISKDKLYLQIKNNLYLVSLINEAKPILNNDLLKSLKDMTTNVSLKKSIEDIKSILKTNQNIISMYEELDEKVIDGTIYSLVLRLRELYLIECIKNNKTPTNKEFISIINKVATPESYNAYLRVKNDSKDKKIIPVNEAKSLLLETKKRLIRLENGKKNQET
jgi:predicted nucleotidyltransferase